jgi:trk system potassium uptake protein TrkH
MPQFSLLFYLFGFLLTILGAAMLIPLGVSIFDSQEFTWQPFLISSLITLSIGLSFIFSFYRQKRPELGFRESFLLTFGSWLVIGVFAALPFYYHRYDILFIDALFESISALTTTGMTLYNDVETLPQGIHMWRSLLQWLGGIGIVVMAMSLLPALKVGGMQLFRSEFSDKSEKILPRLSQIAFSLIRVYLLLTFACIICYGLCGMNWMDSICHGLTTLSTGGLSTRNDGIYAFELDDTHGVQIVCAVFMVLSALTFVNYVRLWRGDIKGFFFNKQMQLFLSILGSMTLLLGIWLTFHEGSDHTLKNRWILAFFSSASYLSTGGFSVFTKESWGSFPYVLFIFAGSIGGSTGSTAGGIKIFRLQVLFTLLKTHIKQLRKPHGIYFPTFEGQKIESPTFFAIITFLILYIFTVLVGTAFVSLYNIPLWESLSLSLACISNVGLGFTEPTLLKEGMITPNGVKAILMLIMVIGRLELMTFYILLTPGFWKR